MNMVDGVKSIEFKAHWVEPISPKTELGDDNHRRDRGFYDTSQQSRRERPTPEGINRYDFGLA